MKWKSNDNGEEYDGSLSTVGIGGFGFGGSEKVSVGKKKLPLIKPASILEGDWYPTTNKPLYHKGDEMYRAEGPGVIKFHTVENNVKYIAFAKINPLSKNPVDPKMIYKIRANSPSLINVPIVWRFNIESISAYEKRRKLQNNEYISSKINIYDKNVSKVEKMMALHHDLMNNQPGLETSSESMSDENIKKAISDLNKYYGVSIESIKKPKKQSFSNEFYSDDEDENEKVGEKLDDKKDSELNKSKCKPKKMVNVAVKQKSGHIIWFDWPGFVGYKANDDLSNCEKSEVGQAVDILEKSEPQTWDLLSRFNE